jgi:hypothetical protein
VYYCLLKHSKPERSGTAWRSARCLSLLEKGSGERPGQAKQGLREVQSGDHAIGPGMKREKTKERAKRRIYGRVHSVDDEQRENRSRSRRESRSV